MRGLPAQGQDRVSHSGAGSGLRRVQGHGTSWRESQDGEGSHVVASEEDLEGLSTEELEVLFELSALARRFIGMQMSLVDTIEHLTRELGRHQEIVDPNRATMLRYLGRLCLEEAIRLAGGIPGSEGGQPA